MSFGAGAGRPALAGRGRGRRPLGARRRLRGADAEPAAGGGRAAWEEAIAAARAHDGPRVPSPSARLGLPFEVADYVDFYSSLEHATNLGRMFRPDQEPLLPNWRWLPVALPRPRRQRRRQRHGRRAAARTAEGAGRGRADLRPEPPARLRARARLRRRRRRPSSASPCRSEAFADHVFGVVLVNDWSARDIQAWEYVPLGPYLGKSFQTSISAWVTPLALLEDARVEAPPQDPPPLAHLAGGRDWGLDIALEVELNGETVSRGNARTLYWTMPQQLAHATSNGASLRTGDLMASGTISGAEPGSEGSMIELFRGERFLEDGDEVVLRGRAANGVELGEVRGRVLPARG